MNILPKKSWHVRNKDNVAKVRQDEENAKLQEKERLHRVALAEQEARTELLRRKSRKIEANDVGVEEGSCTSISVQQPINFFQDIGPDGKPYDVSAKNVEHEEEKRKDKEKEEKKIGLLTYLGQSAVETLPDEEKPWYFKYPSNRSKSKHSETLDVKRKASLDPLLDMKESISKKKKKKHHKRHKEKVNRVSEPNRTSNDKSLSSEDKVAKLRKARLEREAQEKQRSISLLQKHYGTEPKEETTSASRQFTPKYNNQFNPHIARNNRERR